MVWDISIQLSEVEFLNLSKTKYYESICLDNIQSLKNKNSDFIWIVFWLTKFKVFEHIRLFLW